MTVIPAHGRMKQEDLSQIQGKPGLQSMTRLKKSVGVRWKTEEGREGRHEVARKEGTK